MGEVLEEWWGERWAEEENRRMSVRGTSTSVM